MPGSTRPRRAARRERSGDADAPSLPSVRATFSVPDIDDEIARAEAGAIVMWRGEPLPFLDVPERIASIGDRPARDRLLESYVEALDALAPLYERRREAWIAAAAESGVPDVVAAAADPGVDPRALALDLERFIMYSETPYYAALRRYLALIDIEQGDATVGDVWHVVRGVRWSHWFGEREVRRAAAAAGRATAAALELDGWRSAAALLRGEAEGADPTVAAAIGELYASLPGDPGWLMHELGVADEDVAPLADFLAFVRLWRFRRDIGLLQYELRLYEPYDSAVLRAYYSGIVGHMTGVVVPEGAFLHDVPSPMFSARRVRVTMLAATMAEAFEGRIGPGWWRQPIATETVAELAAAPTVDDALARLGYHSLDWGSALRHIRTRLIGEMSGYGGPNITTRAGTRKV